VAVRYLRRAIAIDPTTEVAYYKLALAENMAGDWAGEKQALSAFRQIQQEKRMEVTVLGDIVQHPDRPDYYARAIRYYAAHGKSGQAAAIRAAAIRRFGRAFHIERGLQ
jgi:tetratricopeptide (TPR) repeat protein